MKIRRAYAVFAVILASAALQAHDFWLLPDFFIKPGGSVRIEAHTGDRFPAGISPISLDRVVRFEIMDSGGQRRAIEGLQALEKRSEAQAELKRVGTYVAYIEIKPRPIELTADEFKDYLHHEGLNRIAELREKTKKTDTPGKELYAKFAKSIIQVGDTREDTATRPVGLKLEIVPLQDPARILPGEKLPVRVLFDGKPLAAAQVACVSDESPNEGDYSSTTRTNPDGIAMIPILNPGRWLVRLVHMIPAQEGKDHDWESFFSTLTFAIAKDKGFPLTVESIMRGPDLVGYGISQVRWSGDSSRLFFGWRKPGEKKSHTYVVPREGGAPTRLTEEEEKSAPPGSGADYSEDRTQAVFYEAGELILQNTVTGKRRVLLHGVDGISSPRLTRDQMHVTFVRGNNLSMVSLDSGALAQLTDFRPGPPPPEPRLTESQKFLKEQQAGLFETVRETLQEREEAEAKRKAGEKRKPYYLPPKANVAGWEVSPDNSRVVFAQVERAEQAKSTVVPSYVTDSGFTEDIPSRIKVGDAQGKSKTGIASVETGQILWIDPGQKDRPVRLRNPLWSEDGKTLVITAVADDNKDRWYLNVDLRTGKTSVLDTLHDDAWVVEGRRPVDWMPDRKSIFFISEKEGFFHLYTVGLEGGGPKALTSGRFEVSGPFLSRDKSQFYFTSNEVHPGERHLYSMPVQGGNRTRITGMAGSHQVTLSPDEKTAAVIYSSSNQPPELYLMDNAPGAAARRVTVTPTEEWRSFPWVEPKVQTFKARDGAEVYTRIYTPEMLAAARGIRPPAAGRSTSRKGAGPKGGAPKRPGVLFVHGAGYVQNAHKYWSSYYREYMFHHILMDRGYVVMDVDYRGSAGYGRDWRTGIYRYMGGKDLDDQVDAARWMVENLNVDPARIGLYGGSYGGFITLMAMFTASDTFSAGAALRPVTDWAHYNHPYTSNILNEPQADAEAYTRSSPIYLAEGLKGALLICHGMVDTNVHFQDSVRLAQRLLELRKKNWELAVYPVENHGFERSDSWADEYRRILELFDTHLMPSR